MMRNKRSRWNQAGLILVAVVVTLSGCKPSGSKEDSKSALMKSLTTRKPNYAAPELPDPPSQAYAGSQACAECHEEIGEHYSHHPMGQSLAKVLDATSIEDYDEKPGFETRPAPRSSVTTSYEIVKNDESIIHRELMKTKEGEEIYRLDVPVDYSIGSGQKGRSYIINHSGLLVMSPIGWYSGSDRWDLSPGYEGNNLHFGRRIVDGCLSCHAGRVATQPNSPNLYKPDPFIEESIGCENCHGPGEEHIKFHHEEIDLPKDPIVNPIDLPPRQRDHVCFQCHLVGEHRLTRYGRGEFDFRPGDDITDIWTVFLKGTGVEEDQTTAAVSQVEQMLVSTCYQKSNGKLGCISCHMPHESTEPAEAASFFQSRCLECHSSGKNSGESTSEPECSKPLEERLKISPGNSCVQCHMPSLAANDVPHTSQTDHRILRSYESSKDSKLKKQPQLYIFGESDELIPQPELNRAQAISLAKLAESSGNAVLASDAISILKEWIEVVPDDLDAKISLGTAYSLLQNIGQAAELWESALEKHPRHEFLLRRLMVLYHENGQLEEGVKYAQRLVEVNPWDYEYYGRLAHMLGQLGRNEEAIKAGERALELNPASIRIHQWLSEIYTTEKNTERSEYHKKQYDLMTTRK